MFSDSEDSWMPDLAVVENSRPVLGSWMKEFLTAHRIQEMSGIDWGNGIKGLCVHDEHEHQCHYVVACPKEAEL
jgi:hypothetical protein